MAKKKLFVFGAGHVGKAVARYARDLGFDIFVVDPREEMFAGWQEPGCQKICGDLAELLPSLETDDSSFIVIATFEHALDYQVLTACIRKPHRYLGMIGSANKVARTRQALAREGIASETEISEVDMPIGIDIRAGSASEIAISIVAKLVQVKNETT